MTRVEAVLTLNLRAGAIPFVSDLKGQRHCQLSGAHECEGQIIIDVRMIAYVTLAVPKLQWAETERNFLLEASGRIVLCKAQSEKVTKAIVPAMGRQHQKADCDQREFAHCRH